MTTHKIVRAVDLGYGNTKFTLDHPQGEKPIFSLFKSLCAPVHHKPTTDDILSSKDTKVVESEGISYEAGNHILQIIGKNTIAPLNDQYVNSPEYDVLMKTAISYMPNITTIDILALGLPVQLVKPLGSTLKEKYQGAITIADGKTIHVDRVFVLPQPLGGYTAYLQKHGAGKAEEIMSKPALVVDPGYYTFDWMVSTGYTVNEAQSGSLEGGISSIVHAIAQSISKDPRLNPSMMPFCDYQAINEALRTGKIRIGAKSHPIKKHSNVIGHHFKDAMTALKNALPRNNAIEDVVIVGGCASLYQKALQATFPGKNIHVLPDSIYSNVLGFQTVGTQYLLKEKKNG